LLENITDKQTGLSLSGDFLRVRAYQDTATGVDEKNVDWKLLDDAAEHTYSVTVTSDNAYATCITVKSELLKAALETEIKLYHCEKKISFKPMLYFHGVKDVKLYATLPFSQELSEIYYGTPYGAQKFGHLLEEYDGRKLELFAGDEVCEELYRRYREIHYWMAMENNRGGFALTTLHGTIDIKPDGLGAVLARTVKSGGDHQLFYLNQGMLSWNFDFTSYSGTWESNDIYRKAWEMLHPVEIRDIKRNQPAACFLLTILSSAREKPA